MVSVLCTNFFFEVKKNVLWETKFEFKPFKMWLVLYQNQTKPDVVLGLPVHYITFVFEAHRS